MHPPAREILRFSRGCWEAQPLSVRKRRRLLASKLKEKGVEHSMADPCVLRKLDEDGELETIVVVYVDDLLVGGRSAEIKWQFRSELVGPFSTGVKYYMGCHFERVIKKRSLKVSQRVYQQTNTDRLKTTKISQLAHLHSKSAKYSRLSKQYCPAMDEEIK